MASLIYEISTHAYNKAKYLKSPGKDESGYPAEVVRITKKSERQYKDHAIKFGLWCKDNYKCRHFDDCKPHIQDYADFLIEKDYSAGTIHTYLGGRSAGFGMLLWIRSKSLSDTRHKTPAAAGLRRRIAVRIPSERHPLGCTTLRRA